MKHRRSVITLAEEMVPIVLACRLIGMDVPDDPGYGKSMKVHCPFGPIFHSDGGAEAAFRIYTDTNTAWCFACKAHYTPVTLLAAAWDQDRKTVAVELLDRIGHKPLTMAQLWAEVSEHEVAPDRTLLAEALKTYCRRVSPHWDDDQFEAHVAGTLTRCLDLLSRVGTDNEARQWLAGCKTVMARVLGARPNTHAGSSAGE